MALDDDLNRVIEAIYRAAAAPEAWPDALKASTELFNGAGATLEVVDKTSLTPVLFCGSGVPEASEVDYLEQFISISPRVALGASQEPGDIGYDHQILSDSEMDRDEFYNAFLAKYGFRYFISGCLLQTPDRYSAVAIQRGPRQGHAESREVRLMKLLVPHFRQALDLSMRWREISQSKADVLHALDQFAEGVIVLDGAGRGMHVNRQAQLILSDADGIALSRGVLTFADREAMKRFEQALHGALDLRRPRSMPRLEFTAARHSGKTPYIIAIRPYRNAGGQARAIVFVRDPEGVQIGGRTLLREAFDLTQAETDLAHALVNGQSLRGYAEAKGLSINTIYTHYKRLKEKTGSRTQNILIANLKDLSPSVRGR